jgi:hypothetical protein
VVVLMMAIVVEDITWERPKWQFCQDKIRENYLYIKFTNILCKTY